MRQVISHITILSGLSVMLMAILVLSGCGNHSDEIFETADGTIVRPFKQNPVIKPQISFCKDFNQDSGIPEWPDTVFTLENRGWLNALVEFHGMQGLDYSMIHLDWVGPDQKSMYTKRVDVDSARYISSSISLSPERRTPGNYILKVYYFRELLAYKTIHLLPAKSTNEVLANSFLPQIEFCSKKSKTTGLCIDADSVFTIRKKGRVRAIINLLNRNSFPDRHLKFELEWFGPDGENFYTKKIDIEPGDDKSVFGSSISIPPDKREPGTYGIQLKLFGETIARESFTLIRPD